MRANTTQRRTGTSQRIRDETVASSHYSQRRARNFLADPCADFKGDVSARTSTTSSYSNHAPALPELNFTHSFAVEELHLASTQKRTEREIYNPAYEHSSEPASERKVEYQTPVSEEREEIPVEPSQEVKPSNPHDAPMERTPNSCRSPHPMSRDKRKRRKKAAQIRSRTEVRKRERQKQAQSVPSQPVSETNTTSYPVQSDTVAPVVVFVSTPVETVSNDTFRFERPFQAVLEEKPSNVQKRHLSSLHTARQESPEQEKPKTQKAAIPPQRFMSIKVQNADDAPKQSIPTADFARSAPVHDRLSGLKNDSKEAAYQSVPLDESPNAVATQDSFKGRTKLQFSSEELPTKAGDTLKEQKAAPSPRRFHSENAEGVPNLAVLAAESVRVAACQDSTFELKHESTEKVRKTILSVEAQEGKDTQNLNVHTQERPEAHSVIQFAADKLNPKGKNAAPSPRKVQSEKADGIPKPAVLATESVRVASVHHRPSELVNDNKEAVQQAIFSAESQGAKDTQNPDFHAQNRPKGDSILQFTSEKLPLKEGNPQENQNVASFPRRFQPEKADAIHKPSIFSSESASVAAVHDRPSELKHDRKETIHQTASSAESPKDVQKKDVPTQERPKGRSKLQFTLDETSPKGGNSTKADEQHKESPKGQRNNPPASPKAKAEKNSPKGRSTLRFRAEEVATPVQAVAHTAGRAGKSALHRKISESEQENSGVQAAHQSELAGETVIRTAGKLHSARAERKAASQRSSRLHHARVNRQSEESKKKQVQKQAMKHSQQKKRAADAYQKARSKTEKLGEHVQNILTAMLELAAEKKHAILVILGLLLTTIAMLSMFASCGSMLTTAVDAFLQTTWLSEDADINKADLYYSKLEAELQRKIGRTASLHPNFDEYRFDLDDIGHDPVELISFLSASSENGIFVYDSALEDRLDEIFAQQYLLDIGESTETGTVTRTVRVGESIGTVVTSAYCSCSICCGPWAGSPTASGVWPTANHTLAVDAYNPIVPMGTKLVINGTLYKVEDTGDLNHYGVDFDVYFDDHNEAWRWGHKSFEAYLYDANGSNTVTVTETSTRRIATVILKKKSFDQLAHDDLNLIAEEQYQLYKESGGNRAFLSAPSVYDWKTRVDKNYGYRCGATNAITLNHGVELSLRSGSWVFGGFDGTVTQVGSNADLGTYVTIQNEKYTATYGHLGSVSVSRGQSVLAGDRLGKAGGQPLYVEFLYDGEYYNPCLYLQTGTY